MANEFKRQQVGTIGSYYGGLWVAKQDDKYYWCIENWNTDLDDVEEYTEIDREVYDVLIKHEELTI